MGNTWRQTQETAAGYALLTVTVFILVVTIAGMAFFAMASYETRGALYRQRSSEAFYLADGAIERARAKFLEDRAWRDGWVDAAAGNGTYDLTVRDTTYLGLTDVVRLVATGKVQGAQRRVEVLARVPPSSFSLSMLVGGNVSVGGNLCLSGAAHVSGAADFGPDDVHLKCGGTYTQGFDIGPPAIYTDPAHFSGATYYYVRGTYIGKVKKKDVYGACIFDALGNDITALLGDDLRDVTAYSPSTGSYTFTFDGAADLTHYFDSASGIFRRALGAAAAVVNFGEIPLYPAGGDGVSYVVLDKGSGLQIATTIVNTRFTGVTEEQRLDTSFWQGGRVTVKQVTFAPDYGLALVTHDFQKQGGSQVDMGTASRPALVYVTHDATSINSNFNLTGSIICLGSWSSTGGPTLVFEDAFVSSLPSYLVQSWQAGVAGTMEVLRWREIASPAS